MDQGEVKKLWALLGELYPRQRQAETRERLAAWTLALAPFAYEDIKRAALDHVRRNAYYPAISELTAELQADLDEQKKQDEWWAQVERNNAELERWLTRQKTEGGDAV